MIHFSETLDSFQWNPYDNITFALMHSYMLPQGDGTGWRFWSMELCIIPSHSAVPSLCLRRSLGDDAGLRKVFRPVLFNRNIM